MTQSDTAVTRESLDRLVPVDGEAWRQTIDAAVAISAPVVLRDQADDVTALLHVVPPGYQVVHTDLSKLLATPARKSGNVTVIDAGSFVGYVNRHAEPGTTLFASRQEGKVTAVLNGDTEHAPGWADHTAVLALRHTPEWNRWAGVNGAWQTQEQFAEFVEESMPDFRTPAAATMLEIAQTFEAKSSVDFESGSRLDNGERQLVYKETVAAKAGQRGTLDVPSLLQIGLRPYEGGPGYNVDARLRYRITGGHLALMVKIDRISDVIDLAFTETVNGLAASLEQVDDLLVVHGTRR